MDKFRIRLKRIVKKFGRVVGSPFTNIADVGKKVKQEKGRWRRTRAFFEVWQGVVDQAHKIICKRHIIWQPRHPIKSWILAGVKPRRRVLYDTIRNSVGSVPAIPTPQNIITDEIKLALQAGRNVMNRVV